MKALSIQINGEHHCLAGIENGSVAAAISASAQDDHSYSYMLNVFGSEPHSEQTSFWLPAALDVDDEVVIRLVEVDEADPPVPIEDISPSD